MVTKASEYMGKYANYSWHDMQWRVGDFVWILLEHLSIPSPLTHKLVAKFVGPYEVFQFINPVAYRLGALLAWQIHHVIYSGWPKQAMGLVPGAIFDTLFWRAADSSSEFEVKDMLDYYSTCSGIKYLAK